jgi:hypothetical protein
MCQALMASIVLGIKGYHNSYEVSPANGNEETASKEAVKSWTHNHLFKRSCKRGIRITGKHSKFNETSFVELFLYDIQKNAQAFYV